MKTEEELKKEWVKEELAKEWLADRGELAGADIDKKERIAFLEGYDQGFDEGYNAGYEAAPSKWNWAIDRLPSSDRLVLVRGCSDGDPFYRLARLQRGPPDGEMWWLADLCCYPFELITHWSEFLRLPGEEYE